MRGPDRTDTLGRLIEGGYSFDAYCQKMGCIRPHLDLDIYDLALAFGSKVRFDLPPRWPIRCSACGSNDITYRVGPETLNRETAMTRPPSNFRQSRTDDERTALEVLFPRRWS